MIKAQVLLTRNPDTSPNIVLSDGDSIMDVIGQPAVNIPTNPNLAVWELWTEDISPYETQNVVILSEEEILDEEPA